LCCLEVIGKDIQVALNAIRKPVLTNFVHFFRTSAWIPVVFVAHYKYEWTASIQTIFDFWIGFSVISYAAVAALCVRWGGRESLTSKVRLDGFVNAARNGWYIYINELSIAIAANVDRYVIASVLGLREVGIYTFFWSFSNAAITLVDAGLVQTEWPELVRARRRSRTEWVAQVKTYLRRVRLSAFLLCSISAVVGCFAAILIKGDDVRPYLWLSWAMASYQWLVAYSLANNGVLSSAHDDKFIAGSNLVFLLVYLSFLPLVASCAGLIGVVVFIVTATSIFLVVRSRRVATLAVGCS
jgi:O-antigen/teichoic acid export membrane protein